MRLRPCLVQCLVVGTCLLTLPVEHGMASEQPKESRGTEALALSFGGVDYLHRWSKGGQNEFTPKGDGDLAKWQNMITVNVHEGVRSGDQLAELANAILSNYQRHGKVLVTNSVPHSENRPAEHLIVAVLGSPAFLEAAFARFVLIDGVGMVVVFSHRVYGKQVGPEMSQWVQTNGPQAEKTLMNWDKVPSLAALKRLPQAK